MNEEKPKPFWKHWWEFHREFFDIPFPREILFGVIDAALLISAAIILSALILLGWR